MKLNKKAFTLVEMLIVVVIIGILAAALLPKLLSAQGRARDTARKADLTQILTSLKMYYDDEGEYPTYADTNGCADNVADGFMEKMEPYMSEVPSDPQKNRNIMIDGTNECTKYYAYMPLKSSGTDGGAAVLAANLEVFGKSMNWVLNLSSSLYYLSGAAAYDDNNQWEMRDLVKSKCSEWVFFTGGTTVKCGWTTNKWWATTDWEGVYVVFPN